MRYIEEPQETPVGLTLPVLELTRRNLETLLAKLGDPNSMRMLVDPTGKIAVKAVPDDEHYQTRAPGITLTNGQFQ
jgi:hypothetical protein